MNRRRIRARGDLDCWNMISPMLLAQQSMEETGAFVRFLEESEFEFLPIVTLLRRLEVHKLRSKMLVLRLNMNIITVLIQERLKAI